MCDFPFDARYTYLVYADKEQDGLHATRCSRTMVAVTCSRLTASLPDSANR